MNELHLTLFMIISYFLYSLEIITNKRKKIFTLAIMITFVFLASYRSIYIPDTLTYINSFYSLSISNLAMSYFEIGFTIFSIIIKRIFGNNVYIYFGFITATNLLIIYKSTQKIGINKVILPMLLYISFYGIYFNFIVLRAGLAFSFLCYAYFIFDENKISSFIFFIIACMFHQSAVVGIIGYIIMLYSKKYSNIFYFFWFVLIIVFYFLSLDIFMYENIYNIIININFFTNTRFLYYFDNIKFTTGIAFRFIFNLVLGIFMVSVRKYQSIKYHKLLNIYMVGLSILSFFSSFLWIERITDYFIAFNFILLTKAIYTFKSKGMRLLLTIIIILLNLFFVFRII